MTSIVDRLRLLVPSDSSGAAFDAVNEITRLTAEVEQSRVDLEEYRRDVADRDLDVARLTARVEELEAALQAVFREVDLDYGDDAGDELSRQLSRIANIARAALTQPTEKPNG